MKRRDFIRKSVQAMGAATIASGLERFNLMNAYAVMSPPSDYKALVCIFLNGGNDCNNTLVPLDATGYGNYSTARTASGLAIPQATLLPITVPSMANAQFGLHPNMTGLQTLYNQQKLAIVPNMGPLVRPMTRQQYQNNSIQKPYQLFSHSDQVTQWQTSVSNTRTQTGWGGRVSDKTHGLNGAATFPMVTSIAGSNIFNFGLDYRPLAIAAAPTGLNQVLVLNGFGGGTDEVARRNSMNFLRTVDRQNQLVKTTGDQTQQALDISQAFSTDPTVVTTFPTTTLGNQLKQVAKVIKLNQTSAQLNLERQIFFCSVGGFDNHQNQPTDQGNLLTQVSDAMKAFYDEMVAQALESKVTAFTLSDFGRTLQPSGSGATVGTDHGWGTHMFVMGGAVRGGDFYGVPGPNGTVYPTLTLGGPNDTDTRGRWIPTTSVEQYGATLASWYGLTTPDLPYVFPLLSNFTSSNLGFML
jgi:uncharacterized protein (DUF1501 family)